MAPISTRRKRTTSHQLEGGKQKKSKKASIKMKKTAPAADSGEVISSKNQKAVDIKTQKKIKVTKKFRNLIHAALADKQVKGVYNVAYMDGTVALNNGQDDQKVWTSCNLDAIDGTFLFSVDHFLDAFDRLWMGKNIAYGPGCLKSIYQPGKNWTDTWTRKKFTVKNSYSHYELRNTSQRTVKITAVDVAPKYAGSNQIDNSGFYLAYDVNNTGIALPNATPDPKTAWDKALETDFLAKYSTDGLLNQLQSTSIGMRPNASKAFNKNYETAYKEWILLPGQTLYYKIQGPQNLVVDMEKMFKEGVYQNIQKYTRSVMWIVQQDITQTVVVGANTRAINLNPTIGPEITDSLGVERYDHISIECGEGMIPVDLRKDRYVRQVVKQALEGFSAKEVQMMNPVEVLLT